MSRRLWLLACLWGCGGASEGGHAPSISNLSFTPTTMTQGQATDVSGNFEFEDADADALWFAFAIEGPSGQRVEEGPTPADGAADEKNGKVSFGFKLTPNALGEHTLTVWLEDRLGLKSNQLDDIFTVEP